MQHGSLFSGIGGFDLAADWIGWRNVFHCEINNFCNKLLDFYWPDAVGIKNIYGYDWEKWKGKVDVLSGGWPCQKYSVAGSRTGKEPLKDAMLDVVRVVRPGWCVFENVYGFITSRFADEHRILCEQLEGLDYKVQTLDIDGASVGIPTVERHVWIVASANGQRFQRGRPVKVPHFPNVSEPFQRGNKGKCNGWNLSGSRVCQLGERVPKELDLEAISKNKWHKESLQGIGNAIIPQIAYYIFSSIQVAVARTPQVK